MEREGGNGDRERVLGFYKMSKYAPSFNVHQNKFVLSSFTLMWMHKFCKVQYRTKPTANLYSAALAAQYLPSS